MIFIVLILKLQWGFEYQALEYWKHLNTGLLLVWYSDAILLPDLILYVLDKMVFKKFKTSEFHTLRWSARFLPFNYCTSLVFRSFLASLFWLVLTSLVPSKVWHRLSKFKFCLNPKLDIELWTMFSSSKTKIDFFRTFKLV